MAPFLCLSSQLMVKPQTQSPLSKACFGCSQTQNLEGRAFKSLLDPPSAHSRLRASMLELRGTLSLPRSKGLYHTSADFTVFKGESFPSSILLTGFLPEGRASGQHRVWIISSIPGGFRRKMWWGRFCAQTSLYMSRATGATAKHGDTVGLGLDTEMYGGHLRGLWQAQWKLSRQLTQRD